MTVTAFRNRLQTKVAALGNLVPRKTKPLAELPVIASDGTPPEPSVTPPAELRKVAKKSTARKSAAKKSASTKARRKPAESAGSTERRQPTDDEIRLRAYFIAERRVQMGIPGSESDDWLEARRQLEAELGW